MRYIYKFRINKFQLIEILFMFHFQCWQSNSWKHSKWCELIDLNLYFEFGINRKVIGTDMYT